MNINRIDKYTLQDLHDAETDLAEERAKQNDLQGRIDDLTEAIDECGTDRCFHCSLLRSDIRQAARELAESYRVSGELTEVIKDIDTRISKATFTLAQTAVMTFAVLLTGVSFGIYLASIFIGNFMPEVTR